MQPALENPDPSALAEALPDATVVVDRSGRVVWGNAAAERLFGLERADAIGHDGLALVHPDDAHLAALSLTTVRTKTVGSPIEIRVRSGRTWRLVELVGTPFDDGVLLSLRDLTERRRWELAGDHTERFRSIVQNAGAVVMLVRRDGTVATSSAALTRLLGHDQEWMEERSLYDLVDLVDHPALDTVFDGAAGTRDGAPRRVTLDLLLRHALGVTVPFAMTFVDLFDDPTVGGLVVTGHDISDRLLAEQQVRHANSLLTATLEATADGIVVTDLAGRVSSVNDRFGQLWQLGRTTARASEHRRLLEAMGDLIVDRESFVEHTRDIASDPAATARATVELRDGRILERWTAPQRIGEQIVGRVWSYRDVTEARQLERELAHQALHDPLTALANRALFRDRVEQATARLARRGGQIAVLFIDLDNFKTVNDSLGHSAGDALLIEVSQRILRCLRGGDSVARLGGDEFAVLVDGLDDESEAEEIARRIIAELRTPVRVEGREVAATASVGLALGGPGSGVDELLRNADLAMYTAKSEGKDRVRPFAPEMHRAALDRLDLEEQLRRAAHEDEFVVHLQPIVDLEHRRLRGFEALVRWHHPTRGLVMPADFIGVAEDGSLIDEIADRVLHVACDRLAAWSEVAPDLDVAVNISPGQLLDADFPARVEAALSERGVDPRRLTLEITEGALMRDPDTVADRLRRVRRSGIRIAVDDFGTGYSSLAYLQHFPIDVLKIDRTFVAETPTRPGLNLAGAIVRLARTLDLVPVAEGVESDAQADALLRLGCELGQGFHLGPPVDVPTAEALVRARAGQSTTAS